MQNNWNMLLKNGILVITTFYMASFSLAEEFPVNTYTPSRQIAPKIASNGSNYLVTWQSWHQDGSYYGIYGQLLSSNGSKINSEFRINSSTPWDQINPKITSDGLNYLVVWEGDNYGVYGQRISSTGTLVGLQFKFNTLDVAYSSSPNPAVASNGSNYLVIRSYGKAQLLSLSGEPIGSVLDLGNDYTYIASDGTNYFVSRGNVGRLISPIGEFLTPEYYWDASGEEISIASNGTNYLVTRTEKGTSSDGDSDGVYGQFISSTGESIGSDFLINTSTFYDQNNSSVSSDGTNYLVTWQSRWYDGEDLGVYGQFYPAMVKKLVMNFR